MLGDVILLETAEARVFLVRGADQTALRVVNAHGRVQVSLSLEQADAIALAAPGASDADIEIERRFLLSRLPSDLRDVPAKALRQGYLLLEEAASMRVRQSGSKHELTIKRGRGLERSEVQIEILEPQADLLWSIVESHVVEKTRYVLPDHDGVIELDVYHGRHEGLAVAEREFPDSAAAHEWTPPRWMGREITDDGRYTNARLAAEGVPEDAPRVSL